MLTIPYLNTGMEHIDRAFRIAMGDLAGNIFPFQDGLLEKPQSCILAGLDYNTPWTRDASFNTWYGGGLVAPEASRNTLLSVLTRDEHGLRIGGQYWDAILWVIGAWNFFLYTGDQEFLRLSLEAARNSLAYFEATEFDPQDGLFRGGAVFQDGVAAYPDGFVTPSFSSSILDWVRAFPERAARSGFGLPMKALSTNCVYYQAYRLADRIARLLKEDPDPAWSEKANQLRRAINARFWNTTTASYRYLVDANDPRDRQEGFGHAFAVLFGIADKSQVEAVFKNQFVTPQGIPCVWPPYTRYAASARIEPDGNQERTPVRSSVSFGRHCGTVWPQVNAAWAAAAATSQRPDLAFAELQSLAQKASRDGQFYELYHPLTGEPYGGLQENAREGRIIPWSPCRRQTWCATGYLYMVLTGLFGLSFSPEGMRISPYLPPGCDEMRLENLRYRQAYLTIHVQRAAREVSTETWLPADFQGEVLLSLRAPQA